MIDTWRVAADGEAVVSGSAAPGATVEVVVDDVAVASGAVTASGEFAILFTLAPNPKPSLMWLSMTMSRSCAPMAGAGSAREVELAQAREAREGRAQRPARRAREPHTPQH